MSGDVLWAGTSNEVRLADLTPRAAALATLWRTAENGPTWLGVVIESTRTMREMGGTEEEAALWGDDLDKPHRTVWDVPGTKPGGPLYATTMAARFEAMARSIPLGYIPVQIGDTSLPQHLRDAALDDLLTRDQVLSLLARLGRPLGAQTISNYTSKPATAPAGWPQPARYIGRTPVWSEVAVRAFAAR